MQADDGMQLLQRRSRVDSISQSSIVGGLSIPDEQPGAASKVIDTNKYLLEQPMHASGQQHHDLNSSLFRSTEGHHQSRHLAQPALKNMKSMNPSEPSMVSQDDSTQQRRERNNEVFKSFEN